jgi:hypothetical protein
MSPPVPGQRSATPATDSVGAADEPGKKFPAGRWGFSSNWADGGETAGMKRLRIPCAGPANATHLRAMARALPCALLLAVVPLTAEALPGFRSLPARGTEAANVEQARQLALSLLRRARPALGRDDARLADDATRELAAARFLASSDRQGWRTCATGNYSLFVDPKVARRIFICDDVRPYARAGGAAAIAILAQGFVHESVHLAGVHDECAATRFELAVMDLTIGRRSAGSSISYRC